MKRILFIADTLSNGGGAEALLSSYVNELNKKDYHICIQEVMQYDVKNEKIDSAVKLKRIPFFYYSKYKHVFSFLNKVNYFLLMNKPAILKDVFNLTDFDYVIAWNYQLPSFMLNAFECCCTIGWFHGPIEDLMLTRENMLRSERLKYLNKKQLESWTKAQSIITISNKSYASLKTVFPSLKEKCKIIPNGIDIQNIIDKSKQSTEVILSKKNKHLCCCGRFDENKNFSLAIQALSIIKKKYAHVDLILIGTGKLQEHYIAEARNVGVFDSVVFTGYLPNPFPVIMQCDIFCLTSFSEGFPLVTIEAMVLGKPFITTKVAGASEELCNNEKCGLIADRTAESYAEKVLSLLNDRNLYTAMSLACSIHARNFSIAHAINKLDSHLSNEVCNIPHESLKKRQKHSKQLCSTVKNIFKYILYALFFFDLNWIKENIEKKKNICLCYTALYILSLFLLPIKLTYVFVYLIQVRRMKCSK